MACFDRISDLQIQLDLLQRNNSGNSETITNIKEIRQSLNILSDEIKEELRYSESCPFSYKDKKYLEEMKKDNLDEETIIWLDKNYGGNYKEAAVLQSPKRSPMQRFRLMSKLLTKEVADCKKYGLDANNIKGPGWARNSMICNSSLKLTEIALIVPAVNKLLSNCWDLDKFSIFELSLEPAIRGRTLLIFCSYLANQFSWLKFYHVPSDKFHNFLSSIEKSYKDIPYHNQLHAADVTNTIMHFCKTSLFTKNMTKLDILCCFVAAVIHDVGHTGQTNLYHINSSSFLATRYNDKSVLENYHLSTAFQILKDPEKNFLENLTKEEYKYFRTTVIDMVLGTDLYFHQNQIKKLEQFVHISNNNKSVEFQTFSANDDQHKIPRVHDVFNEKRFIMETALHLSDISNPTKNLKVAVEWTLRIQNEFFEQGDLEKMQNIEISPGCDRDKNTNVAQLSLGFIDIIVEPMYNLFNAIEPEINKFVENIQKTKKYWQNIVDNKEPIPNIDLIRKTSNTSLDPLEEEKM